MLILSSLAKKKKFMETLKAQNQTYVFILVPFADSLGTNVKKTPALVQLKEHSCLALHSVFQLQKLRVSQGKCVKAILGKRAWVRHVSVHP